MTCPSLLLSSWPASAGRALRNVSIGEALREAAADAPNAIALIEGAPGRERRQWTYTALLEQAQTAARALLCRFQPGERVAVWANNIPEWVLFEYAAALAGITIVTVNPALRAEELHHVLAQSRADGIILIPSYRGSDLTDILAAGREGLPALREIVSFTDWDALLATAQGDQDLPGVDPSAAAQIQYTSGTTGVPKGAVLNHRGVINNADLYADRLGLRDGRVQVSPMPLFHTAGCVMSVLGTLAVRGTLVLPPSFDPALVLHLLESEQAETLLAVPTMLIALLDCPQFADTDLSRLRQVLSGGATVPAELVRRIERETSATVTAVFGQTEASPVITQTAANDSPADRAETVGRALPHTQVRIVDPRGGQVVPIGSVGELLTRGYHVMTGYYRDPAATAVVIDDDGWLHTGDLASMDARGYCRIQGRLKDMIIRGGENVYPREIEAVLLDHPQVADVAVVGIPDPVWGEQIAAFLRPAASHILDSADLLEYCRSRLAPHKAPHYWSVVDAFPLTASGKVQKYILRDRFVAQHEPAIDVPSAPATTTPSPGDDH